MIQNLYKMSTLEAICILTDEDLKDSVRKAKFVAQSPESVELKRVCYTKPHDISCRFTPCRAGHL